MCIVKNAYICVYVYIVQYVHWLVADHMALNFLTANARGN